MKANVRGTLGRAVLTLVVASSLTVALPAPPGRAATMAHEVTNVGDKAFTISWTTAQAETGTVNYGTDAALGSTASDDRGEGASDDTHHVTVSGLSANTTYFYELVSGGTTYDNGGVPYEVTTGPGLGFAMPEMASGTVLKADGATAAEGAIVYGSIGSSQVLSALADGSGTWALNIAPLRAADLQSYFSHSDADALALDAEGAGDGAASLSTTVGAAKAGAPDITLVVALDAAFGVDATTADTGQTIQFTDATSGGATPYAYAWDFDNDGTVDSTSASPSHSYSVAGVYTVSLTVTDSEASADTETKPDLLTIIAALAVDFSADSTSPDVGQQVQFTDASSGGVGPYAYEWDFENDGTVDSTEASPAHVFTSAGDRTVSLAVTDSEARTDTETKAAYMSVQPAGILHRVTNVGDKSFTLAWITDVAVTGLVTYGTDSADLSSTANDDRGEATSDDTHHVSVSGLSASTTYYYEIVSGGVTYSDAGVPYEVTTGPGLAFTMPEMTNGAVLKPDGTTPAEGAIVYARIGDSQWLSALADGSGNWAVNIAPIRAADLQSYLAHADGDDVSLSARAGADGTASQTITIGAAKAGAPDMTLALGPTAVPEDGAVNVAGDTAIVVTFSAPMNTATVEGAFSIDPAAAGALAWTENDTVMTLTPDPVLATDTAYVVTVTTAAEEKTGSPLSDTFTFTFTTLDTVPPADPTDVTSTSHAVETWSSARVVVVTWTDAADPEPGTGLDGYSVLWDTAAATLPSAVKNVEQGVGTASSVALADGASHYVHIRAVDNTGNWQSTVHLGPFFIDTTAPTMEAIAEAEGGYYNIAPVLSNFGFDDNLALDVVAYQVDGIEGIWTTIADQADGSAVMEWNDDGWEVPGFDALPDGGHTVYLLASDQAGNATGGAGELSWQFSRDTASPGAAADLQSISHTVGQPSSDNTIEISWTDAADSLSGLDGYAVEWDESAETVPDPVKNVEEGTLAATSPQLADGDSHYAHVRAVDNAGNWGAAMHVGPFVIDTVGVPTMDVIVEPEGGFHNTAPVLANIGFDDNNALDSGWYQMDSFTGEWTVLFAGVTGTSWNGNDWMIPGFDQLPEGSHTIYFKASDDAGLIEGEGGEWAWQFYKDTVAPDDPTNALSPSHTPQVPNNDATIDVTWTDAADAVSGVAGYSVLWDMAPDTIPDAVLDVDAGEETATSPALPDGASHYFHIRSVDNAGNWQSTVHLGPFVIDTVAPTALESVPAADSVDIDADAVVTVTFDEAMDEVATEGAFSITPAVAGTLSWAGNTLSFTAAGEGLEYSTTYTVRIDSGATDVAGNGLALAHEWSFSTRTVLGRVDVTPASPLVPLGRQQQMAATGFYTDGTSQDITGSAQWGSSSQTRAAVDAAGLATTLAQGQTVISAAIVDPVAGLVTGTTTLTVGPPALDSLTVAPPDATIALGDTQAFAATGHYSDGSQTDLSSIVSWGSSDGAVASIGAAGLAASLAEGAAIITATLDAFIANANLTVTAPELRELRISPDNPAVASGRALSLAATAAYSDGTSQDVTDSVTWESSAPGVATVVAGVVTAVSEGTTTVTATLDGASPLQDTAVVTVTAPALEAIDVDQAAPSVAVDGTLELTLTGTNSDGSTQDMTATAVWSSNDRDVATVSPTGLVTGVAPGEVTIAATHSGERATVVVAVTQPPAVAASGATDIGEESATINGVLGDVGSAEAVQVSFQWGLTTGYGNETEAEEMAAGGNIEADLEGLSPNTIYHFRVKAVGDGTALSADQTFTTSTVPPTVLTLNATGVTDTGATLNGDLTELGTSASVSLSFEWGLTAAYGNETMVEMTGALVTFDAEITGLEPSTTYHFRAKAVGSVAYGQDRTFTTERAVVAIQVRPLRPSLAVGQAQQFAATGTYSDGAASDITDQVTWSSSLVNVATMSVSGVATGAAAGQTAIRAQLGTVTGQVVLRVKPPVLEAIVVTPATAEQAAGRQQQLQAMGTFSDGSQSDVTADVIWASSDVAVASVDAGGLVTALGVGEASITASRNPSASALITVTEAELDVITVTPAAPTLPGGNDQQFRALGTYSNGTVMDITDKVIWTSQTPAVATIGEDSGLASGVAQGETVITAALDARSGTATLTVIEAVLQAIAVNPRDPSVVAGQSQQFTATGTFSDQSEIDVTAAVTWTSGNAGVSAVYADGLAVTHVPGSSTITAALDGLSDSSTLTVTDPVLESVVVSPADPAITLVSGAPPAQQFTATGIRSDGSVVSLTATATWESSNLLAATVDNDGLVTTVGAGTTTITATDTASGLSGDSTVAVLADTVPPSLTVTSPIEGAVLGDKALTIAGTVDDANATVVAIINGDALNPVALPLAGGSFSQGVVLGAGGNTVLVRAVDAAGNTGASRTVTVEVDPARPSIQVDSPEEGTVTATAVLAVSGSIAGAGEGALILNGEPVALELAEDGSFAVEVQIVEGANIIVVNAFATDHDGDADFRGTSGIIEVVLDTVAPKVEMASPVSGSVVGAAGLEVTGVIDDPSVTTALLVLNGAAPLEIPVVGGAFSQPVRLVPGANTISVLAVDSVGNASESGEPVTVTLDTTRPQITVTSPANGSFVAGAGITVVGRVSDPSITEADLSVNGIEVTVAVAPDGTFSQAVTLDPGENAIEVTAADTADNEGTSGEIRVTVDTAGPALTVGLGDPTDSVTITVTADEALSAPPIVTVDGAGPSGAVSMAPSGVNEWAGTYGSAAEPIVAGDYVVTVTGNDPAGNQSTRTASFSVEQINVDGLSPTTVTTATTMVDVETNGAVTGVGISVTQHLDNPSGNVGTPTGAPAAAGAFVEIVASPDLRGNLKQVTIRVDYDEADLPPGTNEASLRLYVWDVATGQWHSVPGSGANVDENYIFGTVDHLSQYGGFGMPTPDISPPPTSGPTPQPAPQPEPGVMSVVDTRDAAGVFTETVVAPSADGSVTVTIAQGVTGLTSEGAPLDAISVLPATDAPAPPAGTRMVGAAYDIGPDGATFDPPATVCFTYDPADVPDGVDEERLVLAFWDARTASWVELVDSKVDAANRTVCGSAAHFTAFAVLAGTAPAEFDIGTLAVMPDSVLAGEQLVVRATVTNTGDIEGEYTAELKVDGVVVDSRTVTLVGGAEATLTFTLTGEAAGAHTVSLGQASATFTVMAELEPARFQVSDLEVTPAAVDSGGPVTITVDVRNSGDVEGAFEVVMAVNGVVEETRTVTLAGGATETVTFTVSRDAAATYVVAVAEESGVFTVREPEAMLPAPPSPSAPPPEPALTWPYLLAALGGILLGGLAALVYRKLRAA